jgi:superfamily II DNA or RNA helicase
MTITLTDDYVKRQMAAAVPGARYDGIAKAWVLDDPTPRAAAVICKLFPDVAQQHPDLVSLRNELLVDVRPFDNATPFGQHIDAPRVRAIVEAKGWKLHDYQSLDIGYGKAVLEAHGGFYFGWERGLGKTLATCLLIDAFDAQRTLVVCPNTAKESVWLAALEEFCPWAEVVVMPNTKAKRERTLRHVQDRCAIPGGRPLVFVVHYESLAIVADVSYRRKAKNKDAPQYGYDEWPERLAKTITTQQRNQLDEDERKLYTKVIGHGWDKFGEWDLMTLDEVHRIANPDAQMTRAAKRVPAAKKLGLSGSIIQNHLEELYSPLNWKFPKNYSAKWRDWNDRFLDFIDGGHGKICLGIKPEMVEPLRAELGTFMVYRRKQDELDLPTRTDVDLRVELSPAQRRAYDELVTTCLTRLDDGTVIKADEGAAMMTKLRRIATGLDGMGKGLTDSSKLDLAVDLILDSEDDDWVVFSWYKAPVHALAERLAKRHIDSFVVTGDVPHARRNEAIARFQAGEGRVFIGTLSTLGESVNLQRANNVLKIDRSWNPALNDQADDRVYRQGQTRKTTITNLIAKATVDELNVLPTLANKQALRAAILGGI